MDNVVVLDKVQAMRKLEEHSNIVDKSNIRQSVKNSLEKLNEVENRIDKLENKNFFQRAWGSITGQNERDMVAAMRDLTQAQQLTIQLVLSLAVLNAENQQALDDILEELKGSKVTYTRVADHIDFLYEQVETIKMSAQKKKADMGKVNKNKKPKIHKSILLVYFFVAAVMLTVIYITLKKLNLF